MTNTSEHRPIIAQVNANEAEAVRETKTMVAKANQQESKMDAKNRKRNAKAMKEAPNKK